MRWMRLAATFIIVAGIVTGPPIAAAWWWQRAQLSWPTRTQFDAWIQQPLTPVTMTVGLGLLFVALWLVIVASMFATTTRQWKRVWQRLRQTPIPSPMQATATSMAGAALFGVPAAAVTPAGPVEGTPDQPMPSAPHHPSLVPESEAAADPRAGVDLPEGGWLPPETAQAATIAAALGWLRLRRDYRPGTASAGRGEVHDLPPTVAAIQSQTPPAENGGGEAPAVVGRRSAQPLRLDQLSATGTGLSGPGALDAARGILVSALLTRGGVHVVTTQADISRLLGDAVKVTGLPGLQITAGLNDAIAHLGASSNATVLLTTVPSETSDADRLHATLLSGSCTAVLLGAWPYGTNRHVDADGTTSSGQEPERWCILGPQAAADLCILAAHASGIPPPPTSHLTPARTDAAEKTHTASRQATPELTLTVLGSPALTVRGEPVHVRRTAAMQTLVLLAVHRDGVTARHLGAALWPAERAHATSNRIYTTVSELRRALTSHVGDVQVVVRDDDRYRLDPTHIGVDLWSLENDINTSRSATHAIGDPVASAHRIIDRYSHGLATGRAWPWLQPHRERLHRQVLDTAVILADRVPPTETIAILARAHDISDGNEDVLHRLMTYLAQQGHHDRVSELAIAHHADLASRGLTPSAEFATFTTGLPAK